MGDEDFYAASVTLADHDATLDTVADTAFAPEQEENEKYDNDSVFLEKLEIRAEISKMMGSLGSVQTSCGNELFTTPTIGHIDDIQDALSSFLSEADINGVMVKIQAIQASRPKGITKEFLSKIWMIN